jgi:hypothetical protein
MDKSAIEVIKQFANDYNIPYKELKKKYLITNNTDTEDIKKNIKLLDKNVKMIKKIQ